MQALRIVRAHLKQQPQVWNIRSVGTGRRHLKYAVVRAGCVPERLIDEHRQGFTQQGRYHMVTVVLQLWKPSETETSFRSYLPLRKLYSTAYHNTVQ